MTAWQPPDNHFPTTFQPLGNHMATTWLPLSNHLAIIWRRLSNYLATTWQPLGDHFWQRCASSVIEKLNAIVLTYVLSTKSRILQPRQYLQYLVELPGVPNTCDKMTWKVKDCSRVGSNAQWLDWESRTLPAKTSGRLSIRCPIINRCARLLCVQRVVCPASCWILTHNPLGVRRTTGKGRFTFSIFWLVFCVLPGTRHIERWATFVTGPIAAKLRVGRDTWNRWGGFIGRMIG